MPRNFTHYSSENLSAQIIRSVLTNTDPIESFPLDVTFENILVSQLPLGPQEYKKTKNYQELVFSKKIRRAKVKQVSFAEMLHGNV